jgi:hypothetical protein
MKIVLKNALVDFCLTRKWSSGFLDETLHFLEPKKVVSSLALTAESEELRHFLFMRHNLFIPGQIFIPSNLEVVMPLNLRRFLCEWYSVLYEKDQKEILEFMDLQINQHTRIQIVAKIFGSMISGRHGKNATILVK